MGKEFPVAEGKPFPTYQGLGPIDLVKNETLASRFFGCIHYKAVGQLTGSLGLSADCRRQHRCWRRLSFDNPAGRRSRPDAVCRRRQYRCRAVHSRVRFPWQLQPEQDRLSPAPGAIHHIVLVPGASELGPVPVPGEVRSRFLAWNHRDFRRARLVSCCLSRML